MWLVIKFRQIVFHAVQGPRSPVLPDGYVVRQVERVGAAAFSSGITYAAQVPAT